MISKNLSENFIIREFVRHAVLQLASKKFPKEPRQVIDTELVPRVRTPERTSPPENLNLQNIPRPQVMPVTPSFGKYGKITLLLKDPTTKVIECLGPGQPVSVFRGRRKQPTRIMLSEEEIKDILEKFSDEAHVPLLEGVFKAIVGKWAINAIYSEELGSKFILKRLSREI